MGGMPIIGLRRMSIFWWLVFWGALVIGATLAFR
jgi:hypothetical protein